MVAPNLTAGGEQGGRGGRLGAPTTALSADQALMLQEDPQMMLDYVLRSNGQPVGGRMGLYGDMIRKRLAQMLPALGNLTGLGDPNQAANMPGQVAGMVGQFFQPGGAQSFYNTTGGLAQQGLNWLGQQTDLDDQVAQGLVKQASGLQMMGMNPYSAAAAQNRLESLNSGYRNYSFDVGGPQPETPYYSFIRDPYQAIFGR